MPEELRWPAVAAAVLLWYLVCALRQLRSEKALLPIVVWRDATEHGWSEWIELNGVPATDGYDAMLAAVRDRADASATAVQFAIVVQPDDAPDYTLRVTFMSSVREPFSGPELAGPRIRKVVRDG
jgi:hypothetical protein